ncbi:MAG: HAD hydrolase family protein [Clostridium sp.]
MEKLYFITDLDRTIIHSKNKGFKCVELIGEREITYMTELAYEKLDNLLKLKNFEFIPCTMRNIRQTLRVDFIRKYEPNVIICSNGAQIYIYGELDLVWNEKMKNIVSDEELKYNINYLNELHIKFKEKINILEVRNIEDFYITVKCLNSDEADKFYEIIKNSFEKHIEVIKIEAKIFIIHEGVNKLPALDYVVERFKIKRLITSGDSEVDREFTMRGISVLPKHCEFKHKDSIVTKKSAINSTEEILDFVNGFYEYNVCNL